MNRILYILLVILVVAIACDDFFDEDLEGKVVELIGPGDGLVSNHSSFTFWWNVVDGASKYNLQIVSPSFDAIERLVLDTNLAVSQFEAQLYPGSFQWRVKAFNGASETPYTTYSLSVTDSSDLSGQTVLLTKPIDGSGTNDVTLDFSWEKKTNSEYYTFRVKIGDWNDDENIVIDNVEDNNTTLDIEDFDEGLYSWGVRAENSTSSSQYGYRTFYVDRTAPQKPTLESPADGGEESVDVNFKWTRSEDDGSSIVKDSLFISTDQDFTADIEIIVCDEASCDKEFTISGSSQKYYWRVKSIDDAGNVSAYSSTREFTVNNEK